MPGSTGAGCTQRSLADLFLQDSTFKRFVQVGRVVLLKAGPSAGKIAVVTEIIDHRRVSHLYSSLIAPHLSQAIIDGPTTSVPRQSYPYKHLVLTPILLPGLPRGAGTGVVKKLIEKDATVKKWESSKWAQKLVAVEKRRKLNDFGRFNVLLDKKRRRDVVRKAVKAAK